MRFTKVFSNKEIKKQLCKKCAVLCAVGLLGVAASGTDAAAKSSVSGKLNGYAYRGSIDKDSVSATAVTTFGRGNSWITAKAEVFYWNDSDYFMTPASNSASAGGTSATAKKKIGGADVVAGRGTHRVSYDKYSWGDETTVTGTIPKKYTVKK